MSAFDMLYKHYSTKPRLLFLIDGLGALVSTVVLVAVASFEELFGMPKNILYQLIPIPIVLTAYSLGCYLISPRNWKLYLNMIAVFK